MRWAIGVLLAASAASAEPVDPKHLAAISVSSGAGKPTAIYATGVDPDVVLQAIGGNFIALAGGTPVDGKLGDTATVGDTAAFSAIAPPSTIRLSPTRTSHSIDLDFHAAGPLEILRLLADTAGASYVFAPQHVLPAITVRAYRVDPRDTAAIVAKLAGLELVEKNHVWIVMEPATKLDAKIATRADKQRIEIDHAHPGEARRLLEPDVAQDRNACPKDTWIDASLHGETGALEAVLAALSGPACEQQPNIDELDTSTAQLLGILVGPKVRRAVFRVPHGARAFEPTGRGQRVEVDYVIVRNDESTALHTPIVGAQVVAPGPFEAALHDTWQLRGTVRVGTAWRAIFRSQNEWRIVGAPVEITAGTAKSSTSGKPRVYSLER